MQLAYKLEPAGSHGVWGLDDYQFLPFLLGAAQLSGHDSTPASVTDKRLQEELYEDYLYYEGIRFIGMVKTGPFFEHSVRNTNVDGTSNPSHSAPADHRANWWRNARVVQPILNDIAGSVPTWDKVASGMVKMYEAEVLQKFPVIQVRQTIP